MRTVKIYSLECVHAQLLNHVHLFANLWTAGHQAPLSVEFSKQEYWSGLPFSTPEDLPNSGTEPMSPPLADRFFTTAPLGNFQIDSIA